MAQNQNQSKNNAKILPLEQYYAAGIDPFTHLPTRGAWGTLKNNLKQNFKVMDEQNALNCFTWYNLPGDIDATLIERILYYRGQGMFFYFEPLEKFYFLPFVMTNAKNSRGIDEYGRYIHGTPLPFNGSSVYDEKERFIPGSMFEFKYEVELPEDFINEDGTPNLDKMEYVLTQSCVMLRDYSPQISQTIISRSQLNDGIIDVMSDMVPFARTALLNGTGVQGLRVENANQYPTAIAASAAVNYAALEGQKWIPIANTMEMQELTGGAIAKGEEYFLALQSLDNLRLSTYGLDNGGLFQKKSHMLAAEQEMNAGNVGLVMRDRLQQRQQFCDIVNSIWGLGIWCEASEVALGMDKDGDMVAGDNESHNSNANGIHGKEKEEDYNDQ